MGAASAQLPHQNNTVKNDQHAACHRHDLPCLIAGCKGIKNAMPDYDWDDAPPAFRADPGEYDRAVSQADSPANDAKPHAEITIIKPECGQMP